MRGLISLAAALLVSGATWGQHTAVTPSSLDGVEGSGVYIFGGSITLQQVIAPSQLGIPNHATITGMQFRLDGNWPFSDATTVGLFDVRLGPSNFAPGSLTNSVAANQGPGTTLVRFGSLTFPANSFPILGSPNDFGPLISFNNNYTYTGGDLLVTISHTSPSVSLDFDLGLGDVPGVQTYQAQSYNAAFLTDSDLNTGLVIQFVYAVPEPAFYYSAGIVVLVGAAFYFIRKRRASLANSLVEPAAEDC